MPITIVYTKLPSMLYLILWKKDIHHAALEDETIAVGGQKGIIRTNHNRDIGFRPSGNEAISIDFHINLICPGAVKGWDRIYGTRMIPPVKRTHILSLAFSVVIGSMVHLAIATRTVFLNPCEQNSIRYCPAANPPGSTVSIPFPTARGLLNSV